MKATEKNIYRVMELIDWMGHVELPINDMRWLAAELSVRLLSGKNTVCDSCNTAQPIVVATALGNMCQDCIDAASDEAEETRDTLERD